MGKLAKRTKNTASVALSVTKKASSKSLKIVQKTSKVPVKVAKKFRILRRIKGLIVVIKWRIINVQYSLIST